MPRFAAFLLKYRLPLIFVTLLVSILLAWHAPRISLNNSVEVWFLDNDPSLISYNEFQQRFGNDEIVAVAYRDENLFTREGTQRLIDTDNALTNLDFVRRVTSLSSIDNIHVFDDELRVEPLIPDIPADDKEAALYRDKAFDLPSVPGQVLSPDGKTLLLLVQLEHIDDMDQFRGEILETIRLALDKTAGRYTSTHLGGIGVVYDALNRISMSDSMIFITLSDVVLAVLLWFILKNAIAVILSLTVVGASVICLVGVHNLLGYQVNMVTAALPSLVMIIGIADSIHIITYYYANLLKYPGLSKDEIVLKTMSGIAVPCLFTSITTAIGFGSLMAARMRVIRDLGLFACLGVILAWYFSMALSTWTFHYLDVKPRHRREVPPWMVRMLNVLADLVRRKSGAIIAFSSILFVISIVGITRIDVDTFSIRFLHPSDPCRQDSDWIEDNFGMYMPLEFVVETEDGGAWDPELLGGIARLQRALEEHPDIGRVLSVTDMIKQTNQALLDHEEGSWTIPETRAKVAQQMLLLEMDSDNNLDRFVDMPGSTIRITAMIRMLSARGIESLIEHTLSLADELMPEGDYSFTPTGYMGLYVKMIDYVVHGQIVSFTLAFILVFLMIGALFRSWRMALVAIAPNLLPVIMTLGFMGWFNISLDVATVMIAGIALGIAVDDTIHLLHHYVRLRQEGLDAAASAAGAVKATGTAVMSTSIVLFAGFMVLTLASIKSIVYLGLLTAVTMITALIGDLVLLPALLSRYPGFSRKYDRLHDHNVEQ